MYLHFLQRLMGCTMRSLPEYQTKATHQVTPVLGSSYRSYRMRWTFSDTSPKVIEKVHSSSLSLYPNTTEAFSR